MSGAWDPETVCDALGCSVARAVLARASESSVTADELVSDLDVSEPSVYRRIDALEDFGLLDADLAINPDGNNYRRYETDVAALRVSIEGGEVDVAVPEDAGSLADS